MSAPTNYYAMRPAFELQLNTPLLEGLAVIGRFDGRTPSLVCATATQKLVIHTSASHETLLQKGGSAAQSTVAPLRTLSFGKLPTALAVGRVQDTPDREGADALYFGSATSLLAYDVEHNSEFFYKNMEDGVHAMTWGVVNTVKGPGGNGNPQPLVIVGGICTINGFDESGSEMLWTVTGDQVTALALMPWKANNNSHGGHTSTFPGTHPSDAPSSLVAASDDFELRVFDGEEIIASIMEVDKVHQIVYSGIPGRFAYLSANGTVGVYDRTERVWRVKGRHRPVSAAFCDVDFDDVPELVVGWSSGRVEVRGDDTEKRGVLFRDTYAAPVSAVLAYDYRQNGQPLPLICTVDGTVRGLQLANKVGEGREEVLRSQGAFKLDALLREKQALTAELAIVEEQLARKRTGDTDVTLPQVGTVVQHKLLPNPKTGQLDVVFSVRYGQHDIIIQGCILHSEILFPGKGCTFFTMENPSATLVCPVNIERCVEARVTASVMVGATNAENYQIHELALDIPKFVMYQRWDKGQATPFSEPTGYVTLQLPDGFFFTCLGKWMEEAFALPGSPATEGDFRLELIDMRSGGALVIQGHTEHRELQIFGETMDVCGEVVESLGAATVNEATAVCHFPAELQMLQDTIRCVDEFNAVRLKLSSSMADAAANVKPLLLHAEDARLLSDIPNMRRLYAQLYDLNKELVAENLKRYNNYNELKAALKRINAYIMKAGRLRIGQAKTRLIADCRDAVKAWDTRSLLNLIRAGQN
ncbi:putative intergrin alpha chain protein [Trypanosoma rangeli]|uniref:Putative intergrin alpha chain protein n=1 Tax=Trypanosoma rangeli TaxID=5698 RepID=A0A422NII3_TRYRA|nr:putative intergrin alpha chain protein [Trypanosoma rangeli]RNF05259.1 putative intergrin alpha chain protein [Trypanosoma rangeli]|eukprot:RNF05259.1 putative intergrin alpha chain protein [Trypanosoma rangeli]